MKRYFVLAAAAALVLSLFASCEVCQFGTSKDRSDPQELMGIWRLVGVRFAGGNLPEVGTLYAVADPGSGDLVMFAGLSEEDGEANPVMDMMKMIATEKEIILVKTSDYDKYIANPDGDFNIRRIPYDLFEDGDDLHLYPQAVDFIPQEMAQQEPDIKDLHVEMYRDLELEAQLTPGVKSGDDSWMAAATQAVAGKVWSSVGEKGIDEKNDFVTERKWENSQGWSPESWMKGLPDDMPVAWVNIPGSHDSSTTKGQMSILADWTDAWVQTYDIESQFIKGARYFDFRVGSELKSVWLGLAERPLNNSERDDVADLMMYHGPLCTNTPFIGTMRKLARTIREGGTEFIFINVQAERESDGLCNTIFYELRDKIFGDGAKQEFYAAVNEQSMDIANRLMKKFSREYGDDIFIPYSPNLTVGEARGHIIIIQDAKNQHYSCRGYGYDWEGNIVDIDWLRASFCYNWPDNSSGFATLYTYERVDSLKNDLYVQSMYEMKTNNLDRIKLKEDRIKKLAVDVSGYNLDPNHMNVLGFNALNANTGSATGLETYVFAHEFNGYTYELYMDNMLSGGDQAVPFHCGIVAMDHYGTTNFNSDGIVKVYGELLSWAVIESNFLQR